MSFFTPEQIEIINSTQVRVGLLVDIDFNEPQRFWSGDHGLEINGKLYQGAGILGRVEGLADVRSTESAQVRLTLSGTDANINAVAVQNAADQEGKFGFISFQFFDSLWKTVGSPIRVFTGLTQPLIATRQSAPEGQGVQRSLTLPLENFFFGRSRTPYSLYTSTDQRGRYPGDAFLDYQSRMRLGVSYPFP